MQSLSHILKFKFTWRSYQQAFLKSFADHLQDNRLHLVAPPGSGKTILGIEMLRRVNKNTLVLTPTITIRNQWRSRLVDFFMTIDIPGFYSSDIRNPKTLTFCTYQSLHSLFKSFEEEDDDNTLTAFFKKYEINCVVLDEAHHLKREWWRCLSEIKNIPNVTIIALTATPPYDSHPLEVKRYFDLCGPIDDEIAVPDLVKNGDLCPHQDYIYLTLPEHSRIEQIVCFRRDIANFIDSLKQNDSFKEILGHHPWYLHTKDNLEEIYHNPEFFSSILIFLHACGEPIAPDKLKVLGFNKDEIRFADLSYEWLEVLLQQLLFTDRHLLTSYKAVLAELTQQLKSIGALDKKNINFASEEYLYKTLANSPSKLAGIVAILQKESQLLGKDLRGVVLADYIKKEFLEGPLDAINSIGVIPIFRQLLANNVEVDSLAVLTGSLVILPKLILPRLNSILNVAEVQYTLYNQNSDYVLLHLDAIVRQKVVLAITELFTAGHIKILIGTKSLLGEGWDAPAINTLVLASYVGSFVSSNQMRGRAIRAMAKYPNKCANIWHLACIDPTVYDGGSEVYTLQRRFKAFTGVSLTGNPYIENGLNRMNLPTVFSQESILESNIKMFAVIENRQRIIERWEAAIKGGHVLVHEIKIGSVLEANALKEKKLRGINAAKYLFYEVVSGLALILPEVVVKNLSVWLQKGLLIFLYGVFGSVFILFAPRTFKALQLYLTFGNTDKRLKKIAKAVVDTLVERQIISTPLASIDIILDKQPSGWYECYLKGVSNFEANQFVSFMKEVILPIHNPRYLMVYKNKWRLFWRKQRFYVVPALLSKNKKEAKLFAKFWNRHVDTSTLQYTRSLEGRKLLLKARMAHILNTFGEKVEDGTAWK